MGSYHMGTLLMNQLHNDYIDRHGHQYRYDPEYDCYYRVFSPEEYAALPHWDKYGWIWVTAILVVVCCWVEFIH